MENLRCMTLKQALIDGVAPWREIELDLGDVKVYLDAFPVTHGHRLFVPERANITNITEAFRMACLMGEAMIRRGECVAFNVGINSGAAAGQTVMYPHVHLIPRRDGDCADPVGGVRAVIPSQANYRSSSYRP
jgi:diadenosine tetraphosphate (Ap4A) HIT family hydrolase